MSIDTQFYKKLEDAVNKKEIKNPLSKMVKVSVTEIADGGLDTIVLSLSTTPAHPTKYILEFMGTITMIERENLSKAVEEMNKLTTLTET